MSIPDNITEMNSNQANQVKQDARIWKKAMSIPLLIVLFWSMTACGGQSTQNKGTVVENTETSGLQAMQDHPGKRVYDQYCKACHMADGSGLRGMHPPLINNKTVNGKTDKLIEVTMKGMSGKVVIDGVEYNGIMPPHSHLTDKQIADVLTYIRQSFSNNSGAVTQADVAKLR
jgi:mono/diheme cytochrome c family protein